MPNSEQISVSHNFNFDFDRKKRKKNGFNPIMFQFHPMEHTFQAMEFTFQPMERKRHQDNITTIYITNISNYCGQANFVGNAQTF